MNKIGNHFSLSFSLFLFLFRPSRLRAGALCLSNHNDSQWHHPISVSIPATQKYQRPLTSSAASASSATALPHPKPINTSSNMPFRELLLQQQQNKNLENYASGSSLSVAAAATAADILAANEQERLALANHFQERDRLILQHQQQQLQRKHHTEINEKAFNSSDRIRDFVIGGSAGGSIERNATANKSLGKHFCSNLIVLFFSHPYCLLNKEYKLQLKGKSNYESDVCEVNSNPSLIRNKLDHKYRRRHFVVTGSVRFIDTLRHFLSASNPKFHFHTNNFIFCVQTLEIGFGSTSNDSMKIANIRSVNLFDRSFELCALLLPSLKRRWPRSESLTKFSTGSVSRSAHCIAFPF